MTRPRLAGFQMATGVQGRQFTDEARKILAGFTARYLPTIKSDSDLADHYFFDQLGLCRPIDYSELMFIALYEFKVKAGFEKQFEENWAIVTQHIYAVRGSLGSRLHKAKDGTYVAYAQWPSEAQYDLDTPLPPEALHARTLMKESCETQSVLKLMSAVIDLFKS